MFECPDYLEVEGEVGIGLDTVAGRVTRETAETLLGRRLLDRTDFQAWIEANRAPILHAAFLKRLSKPVFAPGEDRTMIIELGDLRPA